MKRKLLSILCLLSVAITSFAAEEKVATLKFGTCKYDKYVSGYTSSFTATSTEDNITWNITNLNNGQNNNDWDHVRFGKKTTESTATITTNSNLEKPINSVTIILANNGKNAIETENITLSVSTDNAFNPESTTNYTLETIAEGNNTISITNPISNAYYKITFYCKNPSANGNGGQIKEVTYYTEAAGAIVIDGLKEEYSIAINGTIDLKKEGLYVNPEDATLTYAITEGDPAGLSFNGNVITANKVGAYTVTLTANAGGSELSKTFKVNVTKKLGKLSFTDQIVYGKLGVGVVFPTLIVKEGDENPTITYTSSDPENLIVDATTGQIWSNELAAESGNEPGVKAAGEFTVTATMAESANYAKTTASYKVIILDPAAEIVTNGFDEFDFTVKNPYGLTTTSDNNNFEKGDADVTEINADKEDALDVVSISFVTESGSGYRSWQATGPKYDLRVYNGTSMVFEVPEGYVISQIGLAGTKVFGTFVPEEGGVHQDYEGIPSDSQLKTHWHAGADQKLNKVTLQITATSYIDKIYVLYEADNSNLKPAELSFNNTYAGIYNNEPAKLNAVSNPHKLPVTYSIQNLDESLYTIVPSKDGKTIDVTLNVDTEAFGLNAYTLEAKTAENDTFRSGYAIMRLNVYEHLNVTANMMGQELENNNDVIIITSDDEDDMIQFKFDVPEGAKMFYQTRLPDDSVFEMPQLFAASDDDDFVCEEGFQAYDDEKGVWWMPNFGAKLEFYIASYGYKSPKRTLYLNAQDPLMIAFGGTETDLNGTFTYVDHSVNDKSKHTFKLDDVTNISYLLNEGVYPPFLLIDLAIEPMFTPVADEDIPEYDKENDAMKYEDAEAWFDEDSYKLMIKAKHAGKYRLTATLNGFTAKPGQKAVAEIEVTPNLDEVYMHGIDIKDAGNGNFTLNIDKENNPKGRVEYIGTGHPIYGEGNGLWYQLHYDNAALFATDKPQFAATPDEDKWVKADGAFNLVNEAGQAPSDIHLKLTTNGVTKVKSFPIADIETAVAAIEGDNNGEPVYIDMNGMVVKEPSNGIYIRVVNGRADKVMIVE